MDSKGPRVYWGQRGGRTGESRGLGVKRWRGLGEGKENPRWEKIQPYIPASNVAERRFWPSNCEPRRQPTPSVYFFPGQSPLSHGHLITPSLPVALRMPPSPAGSNPPTRECYLLRSGYYGRRDMPSQTSSARESVRAVDRHRIEGEFSALATCRRETTRARV